MQLMVQNAFETKIQYFSVFTHNINFFFALKKLWFKRGKDRKIAEP